MNTGMMGIVTLGIPTVEDIRMEGMSVIMPMDTVMMARGINANTSTAKSRAVFRSVGCTTQLILVFSETEV
jgi:hypothetical protein